MINSSFETYFRQHQVSRQWQFMLQALAQVLQGAEDTESLKALFFKVGERMAREIEGDFASVETLADLQDRINARWSEWHWGWVHFKELEDAIGIEHHAAPLAQAFGEAALPWTVGLLQGFYQTVFEVLGAGDAMRVETVSHSETPMGIVLRFGPAQV